MKKLITVCVIALSSISTTSWAQYFSLHPIYSTIFDKDSLAGFDEFAARQAAIDQGFYGSEFKVKMYDMKREFIDNKYDLRPKISDDVIQKLIISQRPTAVPGCVNEDFEASTPAVITVSNQITGWNVSKGYNQNPNTASGNNSTVTPFYAGIPTSPPYSACNANVFPVPPGHSALIDCSAPGGFVDPQIGSQYPIYSVFGSGVANAAAVAVNPQFTGNMYGSKVLRINDGVTGDYSMEKLSKTFAVTANNALFQFAFLSVFNTGHTCCDAGGFQIRLSNATTNSVIPCPNFSVSAPSSQCTQTVPVQYFVASTGAPYTTSSGAQFIYNRWKVNSMDLSAYISQSITIDIIVADCNAGGHYSKVYFDAQCGPMTINGNGIDFDAGVTNVVVPTCGAAGATICAASGLGPYSWAGPGVPAGYATPSMTNQCFTSTISATYTLYMQPEGSCVPIERVVSSTITPAPLLVASALQATCGNTLAVVSLTPSGSAANPSTLSWSPTPLSLSSNTQIGTYVIPGGNTPLIVTVTASDPLGCLVTTTTNINPAPPYPTFTITNLTGSYSITCTHPSINLDAITTYTYNNGTLNYFWASNSTTFATSNVTILNPGTYTVYAVDPITNCGVTHTVAVGVNTVAPLSSISPSNQIINCNISSITDVTVSTTQTVNVTHNILSPQGGTFSAGTYSATYQPGAIGVYTHCTVNDVNGCQTCKEFTVTSNQGFPTYTVMSPSNFTLGCTTKSVATININNASATTGSAQVPTGGPVSYTIIGPPTSVITPTGVLSSNSAYTVNVPGTWTVIVKDNVSLCESRNAISILQNTVAPDIAIQVPRQVLDCNVPRITLTKQSLTQNIDPNWSFPGVPGNQPGDTITVFVNKAAPNNSIIAQYTLTLTDKSSTCKSSSVVTMYQSLYPPKAVISNGGVSAISCKTPSLVLTNQSSSTIPPSTGFSNGNPVIGYIWEGPSPQELKNNATTYDAWTPGTYTMTAQDLNNGCTNFTTVTIDDQRDYPVIKAETKVLDCGATFANLTPTISPPTTDLVYYWTVPADAAVNSVTTAVLTPDKVGEYNLLVSNTKNGCQTSIGMSVINGSLTASFDADVISGVAPLTVNFDNTSKTTLDPIGNTIKSVWDFGNGTSQTFSSTANTSAVFTQPGVYNVTLYVNKGTCLETKQKQITVEIPSKLEIPNIFTPNGDHVNDVFFLHVANLSEITAVIFDRWGHIVYELTSTTGNIEWDGKNQRGVEVAEGTYFYTITAKGKEGTDFNKNGVITLAR